MRGLFFFIEVRACPATRLTTFFANFFPLLSHSGSRSDLEHFLARKGQVFVYEEWRDPKNLPFFSLYSHFRKIGHVAGVITLCN